MTKKYFFKLMTVLTLTIVLMVNTISAATGVENSGNDHASSTLADYQTEYTSGDLDADKFFVKHDANPDSGPQSLSLPGESNAITLIGNDDDGYSNRISINWAYSGTDYRVKYVAVKASNAFMLFTYNGEVGDLNLYSVINENNGKYHDISHVTFYIEKVEKVVPPTKTFNAISANSTAGHVEATTADLESGESVTFEAFVDAPLYYEFIGWSVGSDDSIISSTAKLTALYDSYEDGTTFVANYKKIAEDIKLATKIYDRVDTNTKVTTGTLGYVKLTIGDGQTPFENNFGSASATFDMDGSTNNTIKVYAVPYGTQVHIEGIVIDEEYEADGFKNNTDNPRFVEITASKTKVSPSAVFKAIALDDGGDQEPEGEDPEPEGEDPEPEGEDPEPEGEDPEPEGETVIPETVVPESNPTEYTLTVIVVGDGSVPGFEGTHNFTSGTNVNLIAKEDKASEDVFEGWSGDVLGTEKHAKVVMNGDKTVIATFDGEVVELLGIIEEVPESAPGQAADENLIKSIDTEDVILDEAIAQGNPEGVDITDDELPQTGGLPMSVLSMMGLAISGFGFKLRKNK